MASIGEVICGQVAFKVFLVPPAHSFQSELFLEEGINVEQSQIVVLYFNVGIFFTGIDNGTNLSTILLELSNLLNDIWEV